MFANPEELALRVISEYKEQNFSNLNQKKSVEDEMEYYYSRWALDEISLCILCSKIDNGPPSECIRRFQNKLEKYLETDGIDESSRIIFSTANKVACDILGLLTCYEYEYFIVL